MITVSVNGSAKGIQRTRLPDIETVRQNPARYRDWKRDNTAAVDEAIRRDTVIYGIEREVCNADFRQQLIDAGSMDPDGEIRRMLDGGSEGETFAGLGNREFCYYPLFSPEAGLEPGRNVDDAVETGSIVGSCSDMSLDADRAYSDVSDGSEVDVFALRMTGPTPAYDEDIVPSSDTSEGDTAAETDLEDFIQGQPERDESHESWEGISDDASNRSDKA